MEAPTWLHEELFTVRTFDIDNHKRASAPALLRMLHEAAMQNVLKLGVSVWDLEPHQLAWVLLRQQVVIERMPMLGEVIKVVTYPSGFDRLFTYRDYKVYDDTGALIAWSGSTWVLMDMESRKLARIPDFIMEFRKFMPEPEDCLPRPTDALPAFGQADQSCPFRVNWHNLDFNLHLTNSVYLEWMLDALPEEVLRNRTLLSLDLQYKAEALLSEDLRAEVQCRAEGDYLHRLVRTADEKELAVGRSIWE